MKKLWHLLVAATGVVVGLIPHVLHHAGLFLGITLVTGVYATTLFGVIGLLASMPILVHLYRRFGNWHAPFIAFLLFTLMFLLSSFVVGPRLRQRDSADIPTVEEADHDAHH